MKTNMINTNSVIKSICAVVMLLGMSVNAWGYTVNLNTSTNVFGLSTTSTNDATTEISKTAGGYTYKLKASNACYYYDNKALFIGKKESYITFPAISGKKLTSVTIWNCSGAGAPSISICPTDDTDPVSGGTATSVSAGSSQTWTLSGTSANTAYRAYINDAKNLQMTGLQLVYSNTTAYTVSFSAISGTPTESSITEASGSAGITLPDVTPNDDVKAVGWDFFGWATSSNKPASLTESAPSIVGKAGDKYYPESNETLYAIYAKGEFTKVTSTGGITSGGKYIIVGDDNNEERKQVWQMGDNYRGDGPYYEMQGHLLGQGDTRLKDSYKTVDLYSGRYVITGSAGSYVIKNEADTKYIDVYLNDWFTSSSSRKNTITFGEGGLCSIRNNTGGYLVVFVGGSFGDSGSTWARMLLYKETTASEYSCTPPNATLRLVASPAVGGTVVFDDNSSAEMDFATAEGYNGDIIATPNDGYDFVNWVSSDENAAVVGINDDPTTGVIAESSATITANFYQRRSISYILTEGGVAGEVGNPTTITKDEKDGFVVGFNLQAHYKDMGGSPMTEGSGADYEWEVDGGTAMLTIHHANIDGDIEITVSATHMEYTKYAFSCAELTLTPRLVTTGTPIFITSAAGKTVRSQDYIEITGSGLTPSTELSFGELGKFAIKNADGTAVTTDVNGVISANAYIFYTPDAGDTSDGLDKLTGITASVDGAKPKTVNLTQDIIGRHLPTAGYVIAGKKDNKWYALPSNMASTTNPKPSEIAVNDINNPSIAYTAASNIYGLEGPTTSGGGNNISSGNGQYVRLTMSIDDGTLDPHAAPLFGSATGTRTIGKSGNSQASSHLSEGWWWALTQTNTSISNPQDAKYTIKCANNTSTLSLRDNAGNPDWGLFASGVEELRLIPASDIIFTEAEVVEWGQHAAIIEVDATAATGIDATSVIAHLNGVNSAAITLSQTRTSVKSGATKYNYTVNFGDGIDFAAAESNGAMLTLEWKKGEIVKAMSNIVVPKIIATSNDMKTLMSGDAQWETEVHVLPGVTLTANGGSFESSDVKINLLEIYPGATVKVTTGTLNVASLVLRNGWTRVGSKSYDVARLYVATTANLTKANITDGWYSDWYIDYDQYYPIAVPFPVATNRITYKNTKSAATAGVTIRYYDGARRAEHEQQNQDENWVAYTWGGTMPANLEPSKGYALTAKRPSGKAFSIVRMPMTFTNPWTALGEHGYVGETHKDQVTVTGYGKGTASWYAMGWNFVGNPYMSIFNEDDGTGISGKITTQEGGSIKYATIPDLDFQNYYQVPIAEANLKPASGFFIQADNASPQTITFNADKIVPPSAPARYTTSDESVPEQEAYIRLSNGAEHDLMGLIIGEDYTEAYEPNADLAKLLGEANAVKTYMHYADMDMAYVAINATLAQEWIPVTVNIPAEGEYTFSITNSSTVDALEGVYLIDYANNNQVTNLIENNYTFVAEAGTISNRFAINAIVGQRETPTDIDIINAGGDIHSNEPVKFIWNDKVFILHRGVIYDSTGKRVREINK